MSCRTFTIEQPATFEETRLGSGGIDPTVFTNGDGKAAEPTAAPEPLFRLDDRTFQVLLLVFLALFTVRVIGGR